MSSGKEGSQEALEIGKKILEEEKKIARTVKSRTIVEFGVVGLVVLGAVVGAYYWFYSSKYIYTDDAQISAPLVELSPEAPSILKSIIVKEGQFVEANAPVARVDDTYIVTNTSGLVVGINNAIGKLFAPGMPVVTMINPQDLRVVALIDENGGFSDIHAGQKVEFTVDAFGSRVYDGTVDEIGRTANTSSVVFNISDKREVRQFPVKIKFDSARYPELLNGMSARVWIYK